MKDESTVIGKRRLAAREEGRASYEDRREVISKAAVKVFHRLGYQKASISAVAKEVGMDRATLYYYFSSKEEMFDAITRTVLESNADLVSRIAASPIHPPRKLRELLIALMTSYAENYPLLYIYIREDLSHASDTRSEWSAGMRELNLSIEQSIVDIVEEGVADGSLRKIGSPRVVAYGLFGMLNWTHRWFKPGKAIAPEEIGKTFAELALAGLESPYSPKSSR